jgi:hypothetical protein
MQARPAARQKTAQARLPAVTRLPIAAEEAASARVEPRCYMTTMPTVRLQGPSNIVFVLEEGTLDDRALLVFTGGQCHALALALQRRTGWPLVAVDETTGVCVHICVRRPDGLLLDVTGAHTVEELITARGGTVRDVDYAAIEELEHNTAGRRRRLSVPRHGSTPYLGEPWKERRSSQCRAMSSSAYSSARTG